MAVFERNDAWWIDFYVNGNRIRRKIGPDKRTAELALKNAQVQAAKRNWGLADDDEEETDLTFGEFAKEYLKKQAGKAERTINNYRWTCGRLFVPYFGKIPLRDITPKDVEDFIQERALSVKFGTVNNDLRQLKTVFSTAIRWGYIKENPTKQVKPIRLPEREPPYLTRPQVAKLYSNCSGWIYTFVAIALNTGMRLSEILALTWDDIDFRSRVIKVRSGDHFTPKSRRNREIPIPEFLLGVLQTWPHSENTRQVLYHHDGIPLIATTVQKSFPRALKKAGLPHFRVHDLRHTYGTTMAANGEDIVTIKTLMGHTNVETTMIYLHAAPNRLINAADNLRLDGSLDPEDEQNGQDMDTA